MTQISRRALLRGLGAATALALPIPAPLAAAAPVARFVAHLTDDRMAPEVARGDHVMVNPALPLRPRGLAYLRCRDGGASIVTLEHCAPDWAAPEWITICQHNPARRWRVRADEFAAIWRVEGVYSFEGGTA